jgi:hypothetical protein
MKPVLFWLLPVVDVFALRRILDYYRSLGVRIPMRHAKLGLLERWIGYLPASFILAWFAGFWRALVIMLGVFALLGPLELYLMFRAVRPWKFFSSKPRKLVTKIFLLEGYNVVSYYLFGAALALLVAL